uniref:Uncharacterized protein n=1 Tax=Pyxicephalus adspersus TaxID=30357 RepID=A0AAV3AAV4_PYXAD|nr:TPA: hypothetical protein GDO54_008792 [Pyxicephalus adspersus]
MVRSKQCSDCSNNRKSLKKGNPVFSPDIFGFKLLGEKAVASQKNEHKRTNMRIMLRKLGKKKTFPPVRSIASHNLLTKEYAVCLTSKPFIFEICDDISISKKLNGVFTRVSLITFDTWII